MAPTSAVGGLGAVAIGAAVAVVVHPGEIRPERGVVLGENGPPGTHEARRERGVRVVLRAR